MVPINETSHSHGALSLAVCAAADIGALVGSAVGTLWAGVEAIDSAARNPDSAKHARTLSTDDAYVRHFRHPSGHTQGELVAPFSARLYRVADLLDCCCSAALWLDSARFMLHWTTAANRANTSLFGQDGSV